MSFNVVSNSPMTNRHGTGFFRKSSVGFDIVISPRYDGDTTIGSSM